MQAEIPDSLRNCIEIIRMMRKYDSRYEDACRIISNRKEKSLGTIRDACTRFGRGGTNCLSVCEVERQIKTGEIKDTLKRKFSRHANWINEQLRPLFDPTNGRI